MKIFEWLGKFFLHSPIVYSANEFQRLKRKNLPLHPHLLKEYREANKKLQLLKNTFTNHNYNPVVDKDIIRATCIQRIRDVVSVNVTYTRDTPFSGLTKKAYETIMPSLRIIEKLNQDPLSLQSDTILSTDTIQEALNRIISVLEDFE